MALTNQQKNKIVRKKLVYDEVARRVGVPRTDAERRKRHQSLFGTTKLPKRGTGLKQYI